MIVGFFCKPRDLCVIIILDKDFEANIFIRVVNKLQKLFQ
jgi:hypothetical protein